MLHESIQYPCQHSDSQMSACDMRLICTIKLRMEVQYYASNASGHPVNIILESKRNILSNRNILACTIVLEMENEWS